MRVTIGGKGVLQGTTLCDIASQKPKCLRFAGVPYALPPIGTRRWQKPFPLPVDFSYGSEKSPGQYQKPTPPCPQLSMRGQSQPSDEDCLKCNIYVPIGKPPTGGWPVFFYIHGGFLQFGSNSSDDPSGLLSESDMKCIMVSPGYRLGIFGFLASREIWKHGSKSSPGSNFGLWDQRLALEWTFENIEYFGGDKRNITCGGLSAGSYATFHQLAHDINPSSQRQLIRRVFQWSNGCGVEPKRLPEVQQQFDDLIHILNIPESWSDTRKLESLREKTADELVTAVGRLDKKFFRPILDDDFISEDLFDSLYNGRFGKRMEQLGIQTVIGDLTQEFHVYQRIFPPYSYKTLIDRLSWDYPQDIAAAISLPYKPSEKSPLRSSKDWEEVFGQLYADMQIHSTMRGFLQSINLDTSLVHRYRIDWRTRSIDKRLPKEVGATHGTDMAIWFYGNGDVLTPSEKELIQRWLQPVAAFIKGENVLWGTKDLTEVRYLTSEGKIEIRKDEAWESKLPLWTLTKDVTLSRPSSRARAKI